LNRRAIVFSIVIALAISLVPAFAGADTIGRQSLQQAPSQQGSSIKAGAYFTETYRSKGWVQSYGKVKVRNLTKHRLHVSCTIYVKTGSVVIGSDVVDLVVPRGRARGGFWGVEGGDEGGPVTGSYRCRT